MLEDQSMAPLDEKPEKAQNVKRAKSTAQLVIEEFLKWGVDYAELKDDILKNYNSTASCARRFGRVIKTLGHSEKVKVYSDSEKVYLELRNAFR